MKKIYKSITELIGNTPLLELSNYNKLNDLNSTIIGKIEYFNPGGSVKDRIGLSMIQDAENNNLIDKDTVIIEPTSGNTGIGLALAAAARGYRLILTMPDTMSIERIKLIAAYGAQVILTPGEQAMLGAIKKAEELKNEIKNSIILQQFENPSNSEIHRKTTAQEILRDTAGDIDIFVAGVGTGGTITGVGEVLKKHNPNIQIVAVEPYDSAVLSGKKPNSHKIQGIGAGFIPGVLNLDIIDEVLTVSNENAFATTRLLGKSEGLLVGMSSGAALYAATEIAKRSQNKNKNIVVLLADTGERYLSSELF